MDLKKIFNEVKNGAIKHSPQILTGIGIAGMVTTTVMAVRATPKALDRMQEVKKKEKKEHLTKKEVGKEIVTKVAPCYVPSVLVGTMSVGCLIGSTHISARRTAAIATSYSIAENALKDYQAKVVEMIGDDREKIIREEVAKDHMDKVHKDETNNGIIVMTGDSQLIYEETSGRYFNSTPDKIKAAFNNVNAQMIQEMYVSQNDLYFELNMRPVVGGDDKGWNIGDGLIDYVLTPDTADDGPYKGQLCWRLAYRSNCRPRFDYRNLH